MRIRLSELRHMVRRIIREESAGDPRSIVSAAAEQLVNDLGARLQADAMMRPGSEADATLVGGALGSSTLELSAHGIDEAQASLVDRGGHAERGTFELVDEVDLAERVNDWLAQLGIGR